jgi:hypothetical protein
MTDGLLVVLSEPGTDQEREFHEWYDQEHAPARLRVPGIRSGYRYHQLDGLSPAWLAWYELDLAALEDPGYQALRAQRRAREQAVLAGLRTLDRRVYSLFDERGVRPAWPAPVVVLTSFSGPDEGELDAWYVEEHIPKLHAMPGWYRTRRYRLTSGDAPHLLAFHEIAGTQLFETPEYRAATSGSRWRERIMDTVVRRERRVFGHHRTVGGSAA